MISHRALHVWRRNFMVYRTHIKASLVGNIGEPIFYLFAMGLGLGGYIKEMEGMSYIKYIAPGLIVTSAMYSAAFELTFGAFTRMTTQRIYDSILATPVSLPDLVFGEMLWGATKAMISAGVMLVIMIIAGLYVPGPGLPGIIAVVVLTGFVFGGAALCFSAVAPSYEFFNYFFTMFIAPMFFLSGVFFPLDGFPAPVRWFSQALPATHSVNLIRHFFHGTENGVLAGSALFLLFAAGLLAWAAVWLTRRRMIV